MAFRLEAELFRRRDSKYVPVPLDLIDGVGLAGLPAGRLFIVLEAGIRGGGMESCLTFFGSPFSAWARLPFLEALRFHDKLSFLLSEVMDEGVGGSSGLESGGGDLACRVVVATGFGARGPEGLV
jgi:hypothetical protein